MPAEVDAVKAEAGTLLPKPRGRSRSVVQRDSRAKWSMLAILSVLSAINQAICYSYAPIDSIVETRWQEQIRSEHLITIYFISYIPCSFIGSWVMDKFGLRFGVLLGGFLQAGGAFVRYFSCSLDSSQEPYVTVLGQLVASFAMPFMVNSPAVLSANWFPPSLRATSTSIAINSNELGTAIVYLTAPFVVVSSGEIPYYNFCIAVLAAGAWVVALLCFRSYPKEGKHQFVTKSHLEDDYDWGQWANAFSHSGFWHTVVAFSVAECALNSISALLTKFLDVTDFSTNEIGLFGAAFIVSSLVGSQFISRFVDSKRNHKTALQLCLVLVVAGIILFRMVPKVEIHATLASLLFLGFVLGPIQPIALELGVECAFPTSEATVAALQQLCGNSLSAATVPALSTLLRTQLSAEPSYSSPEWILATMVASTFIIMCFFNGEHKRYAHESKVISYQRV